MGVCDDADRMSTIARVCESVALAVCMQSLSSGWVTISSTAISNRFET